MTIDAKLRVIDERAALDEKIEKLETFIRSDNFNKLNGIFQRALLRQQLELMKGYSEILSARLAHWG